MCVCAADAKIDSEKNRVVISAQIPDVYQQVTHFKIEGRARRAFNAARAAKMVALVALVAACAVVHSFRWWRRRSS